MVLSINELFNSTNDKILNKNLNNNCEQNLNSNNIVSIDDDKWSAFDINDNFLCNDFNKIDNNTSFISKDFLCNKKITQNSNVEMQTLDYFTGNNFVKPKHENKELFTVKPQYKKTNLIYNIDKNRLNISNKQNNTCNIEQILVGPGIGLNYVENTKHGKNNGLHYRPSIRTIDDIRVQNKLQKSYTTHPIKGNTYYKGSIIGKVSKNKPEQFKINTSDDLVRRSGMRKDRDRNTKIDMKKTHKEHHMEYFGSHQGNHHQYNSGKYNDPKRNSLPGYNNNVINSTYNSKHVYDPNNLARDTIKQTTIYSSNNHHINPTVREGYINDPNNLARDTMKQTTINNNHLGSVNQKNKTYTFDPTDIPATTLKEIITNCYHVGIANGTIHSNYTFNPDDIPAPTLKEMYINTFYLGTASKTNSDAYKILDPEVRQTLRSIHSIFYTSIMQGPKKQTDYSGKICINDNKNDIETRLNKIIKLVKGSFPTTMNQNQIGAYNAKHGKYNSRTANIYKNNLNPLNKSNIGEYCSKTSQSIDRIDPDNLKKQLCSNPYVNNLLFKYNNHTT